MGQRQSQPKRHGRGEAEVLQVVIARVRPQRLPFMANRAEIRNHQFFTELRRDRFETIVSFHRTTLKLVCSGQLRWAGVRSARECDYREWLDEFLRSGQFSRRQCASLAIPVRSD